MAKITETEHWKDVKFDSEYVNKFRIQVSDLGRVRSFHKLATNGNLLKGSMIKGYPIFRFKFASQRPQEKQRYFDKNQKSIRKLTKELNQLKLQKNTKKLVKEKAAKLDALKKKNSAELIADMKSRTFHAHLLLHKLVAKYFLKKPTAKQKVVAHLDYNKLNNRASNLKWMTLEENFAHIQKSPNVIQAKKNRRLGLGSSPLWKLKEKDVAQIKKMLKNGELAGRIAKQYNVSETQIIRIKKGENWTDVKAAK